MAQKSVELHLSAHTSPFLGSEILTHSECVRKPPLWVRLVDPRCGTAVSCPTSFMTPNLPKKWWYVMICDIFEKRTAIFDQANLEILEIFFPDLHLCFFAAPISNILAAPPVQQQHRVGSGRISRFDRWIFIKKDVFLGWGNSWRLDDIL